MQTSGVAVSIASIVDKSSNNIDPAQSGGAVIHLPISTWAKRVLGSVVILALKILRIEGEVQSDVEIVVSVVDKVAVVAEKVAGDVAEAAPPNGNIRQAALQVENVAEIVAKDAEHAEAILHKVDELREKIEDYVMVEKADLFDEGEGQEKMEGGTGAGSAICKI